MDAQVQRRRWIPIAVLAVGMISTAIVSWQFWHAHRDREQVRFSRSVLQTRAEISKRMATCIAMLRATAGLFAASEYVTAPEFHRFVERLELDIAYPGIGAIGFSERSRERAQLEMRIARELGFSVGLHPSGERPEYHAIVYIEPLDETNLSAIGYDLFTEPDRRAAMEHARDSGEPAATGPITLLQDAGQGRQGFHIYLPLFEGGDIPATIDERRQRIVGFVHCPIRASNLLGSLFSEGAPPVEFAIYDGEKVGDESLLYAPPGFDAAALRSSEQFTSSKLDIAGHTWRMLAQPGPVFRAAAPVGLGPVLTGAGVLISLLLFGLVGVQTRAAERSERTVQKLRESEARKGAILESALDAIITIDHEGRIIEWNHAAERIFGRSAPEVIGKHLSELIMPESLRSSHLEGMARFLQTGYGPIVGRRIETTALHASSTTFPVEVSICRVGADNPPRFTGFVRDITERVRTEQHQTLMSRELDHRVKNNLATVIAILSESARRSGSIEALVRNATGRIRALAALHEMLAARRWQGAELGELVSRTLAPYLVDSRRRIVLSGPSVTLPGRAASSLCMAVHELATNAAKYGSLSTADGTVSISWTLSDRAEGPWLALTWQEHRGPPVVPPAQRGFGSELIEHGIAFEVGGTSVLDFRPEGVVCSIEIPCSEPEVADAEHS